MSNPEPGQLWQFEGGWHVAGPESSGHCLQIGTRLVASLRNPDYAATPLLSPRGGLDADGVMAAIVAGIPGATKYHEMSGRVEDCYPFVIIELEAGNIVTTRELGLNYRPKGGDVTDRNTAAVRRDMDKRDALAAWLAGEARWGAGEGG